jgi:hypothetical protein
VKTRQHSDLPGQRQGRRRRGALGHARSEAERCWRLQTWAIGAAHEVRRGEASGPGLLGRRASNTEMVQSGVARAPGR